MERDAIPADLRRRILVEAGHRCAIPTCRHIKVEIHHIVPWAKCRVHEYDNLIALCPNCHTQAHDGAIDSKSLRLYKLNLRFAHDKYSQVEIDTLFELAKGGGAIPWPSFNTVLLRRILESKLVHSEPIPEFSSIALGFPVHLTALTITETGKQFVQSLGVTEL